MDYWYTFKLKALFTIDVFNKKTEEEAAEKANEIADEFVSGIGGLEVVECEIDDQGETEDKITEGEKDYEVYLYAKIPFEEVMTAKSKIQAIEDAEEMFLDNLTRKKAFELIEENLTTEKVINEEGEVI